MGKIFKNIPSRRRLGMALIALSVLAAIIMQFTGLAPFHPVVLHEESNVSANGDYIMSQEVKILFNWRYLTPLLFCGEIGLLYLFWPTRRPPRLDA